MVGASVGVSIDIGIAMAVGTGDVEGRNALLLPPPNGLDGAGVGVGLLRSANRENPPNSVPSVIAVFVSFTFVTLFISSTIPVVSLILNIQTLLTSLAATTLNQSLLTVMVICTPSMSSGLRFVPDSSV